MILRRLELTFSVTANMSEIFPSSHSKYGRPAFGGALTDTLAGGSGGLLLATSGRFFTVETGVAF